MRWLTYLSPDHGERVGLEVDGEIRGLDDPRRLVDLVAQGPAALAAAAESARTAPTEVLPTDTATLCAPIPVPPSVRDFMSFEEHVVTATEAIGGTVDPGWYENPVFYFSNPAAVVGPRSDIAVSPGSHEFDYELEVAIVIGEGGSDISVENAGHHIAGATVLCDWSARDLQRQEMRQTLGPAKGKDSATSLGPALVTLDEIEHLRRGKGYDLELTAEVNGLLYSSGSWSTIFWSFEQMVAYASRGTVLRPGDVIGSGTVGTGCILELARVHGEEKFPYLRPGDRVTVSVEQLGSIESLIVPGASPLPLS